MSMTPRQLLALAKRHGAVLDKENAKLHAQLAKLREIAKLAEDEIAEARDLVNERLYDEDGEIDERDEEIAAVLDEQLFPPSEDELEEITPDWDTSMKRFTDGISSLEDAIASR